MKRHPAELALLIAFLAISLVMIALITFFPMPL